MNVTFLIPLIPRDLEMAVLLVASLLKGPLWGLWSTLRTWLLVLLLSNGVQSNPGPVRFPCSVCFKPVCVNQRALQCDVCAYWCHCVCCGVDQRRYATFQNAEEFNWLYPKCVADEMPFHDCSFLSSRGTSDGCSSFSSSGSLDSRMLQFDLPSLSSTAGL